MKHFILLIISFILFCFVSTKTFLNENECKGKDERCDSLRECFQNVMLGLVIHRVNVVKLKQ